ncbi:MAG: hypothetical protein AABY22_01310 [Nanoarchaeota archaeon]
MSNLREIFEQGAMAEKKKAAKDITFTSDGKTYTEKAVVFNDAFYEIVGGKYNGNLVHRWDVKK